MNLSEIFKFSTGKRKADGLPEIFPLSIQLRAFVDTYLQTLYSKILTDVFERTSGIAEEKIPVLFDNCLGSETPDGLITLLSKAMACKGNLYLIYNPKLKTLRPADSTEEQEIAAAYKAGNPKEGTLFVSFKNNTKSDMIKFYSEIEFATTGGLYKQANLSRAIQFKMKNLRASVATIDKKDAENQAKEMAESLAAGRDALMDGEDTLETVKVETEPIDKTLSMIESKLCLYVGMPKSYFTGDQSTGMGDSGGKDGKAIERGLKNYYFSVSKPVSEALFGGKVTFKTQDFSQIASALSALTTFELVGEEYISKDNKLAIINALTGMESKLGEPPPEVPPVDPNAPPAKEPAKGPPDKTKE